MSAAATFERMGAAHPASPTLEETLEAGLQVLGVDASAEQQRSLIAFVALMAKWNEVYNLTSVRVPHDMLVVHLLDSLSILALLDGFVSGPILDVGSGAGLPAIPLAIARPQWRVESVDAVAKKIGFQLQARTTLGLSNLTPVHARIEDFTPTPRPSVIVTRAYAELSRMLASIDHLVDANTTVVAMKGVVPTSELAAVPPGWDIVSTDLLTVPFLGADRCAVVLRRSA